MLSGRLVRYACHDLTQRTEYMRSTIYDGSFWTNHLECLIQSARVVVPLVTELVAPQSVLDIGCGVGAWLGAFSESGVKVLKGLDGDYIDRSRLYFDESSFTAVDLQTSIEIPGKYDLAACLEVAEHLPAWQSERLVTALTGAAPVVLFSAAIPRQGGSWSRQRAMARILEATL